MPNSDSVLLERPRAPYLHIATNTPPECSHPLQEEARIGSELLNLFTQVRKLKGDFNIWLWAKIELLQQGPGEEDLTKKLLAGSEYIRNCHMRVSAREEKTAWLLVVVNHDITHEKYFLAPKSTMTETLHEKNNRLIGGIIESLEAIANIVPDYDSLKEYDALKARSIALRNSPCLTLI